MFTKLVNELFGRSVEPLQLPAVKAAASYYSLDDARDPTNARDGWYRSDLPQGRRARRIEFGDLPRAAPQFAPLTGAQFVSRGVGYMDEP